MSKEKFFFTFGQDHTHRFEGVTFDCDSVVQINAENESFARAKMIQCFALKWGFCYDEEQMKENFKKYYPRGVVMVIEA